jgi:hypothetical protein
LIEAADGLGDGWSVVRALRPGVGNRASAVDDEIAAELQRVVARSA